jgi:ATP-binding cassette, subfamily F, member 3
LNNVSLKVYRNDKIAIVGNNGIGKTTLVKALTGENKPLSGEAKTGYNVKYAYFTQNTSDMNLEGNLMDFINRIRPDFKEGQIRNLLAKFYFTGDKVFDDTNILSGGEKTRLAILSFILKKANLLLLDEPTNHLDIFTIDSLGSIMKEYPGTIIAISHDREFIDEFAEKIILIHPNGVDMLEGNFSRNDEYIMDKLSLGRLTDKHFSRSGVNPKKTKNNGKKEKAKPKKKKTLNVFKINQVEKQIDELEKKVDELREKLGDPEIASNYKELQEIQTEIDDAETSIMEKMEEWEKYHK